MRKRAEGVWNIVRFNWHFYAGAGLAALLLAVGVDAASSYPTWRLGLWLLLLAVLLPTVVSLLVSWYVYDVSGLYEFRWLPHAAVPQRVVNIHAGFDETSALLRQQFPEATLRVLDFYDPAEHTEISIRRARAAVAPYSGAEAVRPDQLPLTTASADLVVVMLAAHEIRQPAQRVAFLREIGRVLAPDGRAVVVEHLRDTANFMAYTAGFLHFYSRATWLAAFQAGGLRLEGEQKLTRFISAFTLCATDGSTS
ncbi:class I SAM-dependent methyltransferase [Hymenobacter pini]|uniref:class I SAM-dependent methyltransferase n=1 Tax=Hymenobacter pini TaxID=2880879 RepID=UPI001CF2500D|nr:class I SAM-dependent methyltransferase [Hymenobacter pini]MCA8830895.1 methyltransferase domain-containing protein [Hymenobacter pini]